VMRVSDVRVPRENILLAEGKGLRVALTTLNTGRLTLPAACVGLSKRGLELTRHLPSERGQWGAPIGKHAAIADKLARMAGGAVLNSRLPLSQRLRAAAKAGLFYARWYPKQWLPFLEWFKVRASTPAPPITPHLRYAARASRKLARTLFHAMLRHGPKLERQQ